MPPILKRPLDLHRVRSLPTEGFSWVDRRFVRDHFADPLTAPALLVYFFLCAVSDRHGLSFFGNARIGRILKLDDVTLDRARLDLVHNQLIRYVSPLYQVLSLPDSPPRSLLRFVPTDSSPPDLPRGSVRSIGEVLRGLR